MELKRAFLLAATVASVVAASESSFISDARQITFEGKAGEGYFSPDGSQLIFQSVREPGNPFYQMYILSFETGDLHRVSPGIGKTTCGFFRPGSDEVLFASTHHDPAAKKKQEDELAFIASGQTRRYSWDYDETMDIFSARRDGSQPRRLTSAAGYDAEAAYSPDGSKIVFSSTRAAFPLDRLSPEDRRRYENDPAYFAEILIMNADGSGQTRLTSQPGYDGGPFFTADGKRIVWRRFDEKGLVADIFTMRLDGSDVRQITRFESMSWAPFPHPSGKYFVFTSNKHGFENFELFIVDAEGRGEPARVTFTDGFDGLPVFSPDGAKLCWTSNRRGNQSQLFLANWNHQAALQALAAGSPAPASSLSPEIRASDARTHVAVLASDEFEGRKTGEAGARKAAEYLAEHLREFGVQPLHRDGYFHEFNFAAGVSVSASSLYVTSTNAAQPSSIAKTQFGTNHVRPLSFSANGSIEAPVVFAGYGLSVPGQRGYDSYDGLDVTNKVVLVLRYVPENISSERRQELNRYAALRYKAMIARERGAKAILVIAGPNSPNAGQLIELSSDGALAGSEILAASISTEAAEKLIANTGKSLREIQTELDSENPHVPKGFALASTSARITVELERQTKIDRNVIGVLPGRTDEYVMIGAHYDHLGFGEEGGSRGHRDEAGQIHNGADDNASGVAAVLELAQSFAALSEKPKRGLIVAFWSGEEMGLLGSSRFADQPPIPLTNIVAYLNFDMVGRLRTNRLAVQGTGSSTFWPRAIERRNVAAGFDISMQEDPFLPSDSTAFYPKGIPILAFFTGSHDDYHRPSDDTEKVNFDGIERITKFARLIVNELLSADSRPEYVKVDKSSAPGARDALRVYLGTIPDYATDVKGVKISGVRGGSPAEKAGLKAGDVLVQFAGQQIANIYDYTYALDAARIGQPLKLKVLREGREIEITVTPEARK
jgi:Tol biopolymer transport system component